MAVEPVAFLQLYFWLGTEIAAIGSALNYQEYKNK